jgi:hypothetical protein
MVAMADDTAPIRVLISALSADEMPEMDCESDETAVDATVETDCN